MDTRPRPHTSHTQLSTRFKAVRILRIALYVPRETSVVVYPRVLGHQSRVADTQFASTRIFWLIDLKSIAVSRETFPGSAAGWIGTSTWRLRGAKAKAME